MLFTISINAQVVFNLQGGTTSANIREITTLTYQVGLRYQPGRIGAKASYNHTNGLYHTFESWTASAVYQPFSFAYVSTGYRHDRGAWGRNGNGLNIGVAGLVPIMDNVKVIISADTTLSDIVINNFMAGFQIDLVWGKETKNRFF